MQVLDINDSNFGFLNVSDGFIFKPRNQVQPSNQVPLFRIPLEDSLESSNSAVLPTFNRDTGATVTDFEGVIHECKIDELRFQGARRVENLLSYSEDLTLWDNIGANGTVTKDRVIYPATSATFINMSSNSPEATYAISADVKSAGNGKDNFQVYYREQGSSNSMLSEVFTATDEWVRVSYIFTGSIDYWGISNGDNTYETDIYIKSAQLEKLTGSQTEPSDYISNGVLSWPYHGAGVDGVAYFTTDREGNSLVDLPGALIEDDGENLVAYSEDLTTWSTTNVTVTGDQAISPDGALTADKIVISASGALSRAYYSLTNLPGGDMVTSVWLKGGNVTAASIRFFTSGGSSTTNCTLTSEWQRFELPLTSVSTSGSLQIFPHYNCTGGSGDVDDYIYAWGAQVEGGSEATSYIPTDGAAVTRTADELSYDVSNVITQGQGSLYCEFVWNGKNSEATIFDINDETNDNAIRAFINTDTLYLTIRTAGVEVVSISTAVTTATKYKIIATYQDNDVKFFVNGSLTGSDTNCTIPVGLTTLCKGCNYALANQLNGTIGNGLYYNKPALESFALRKTA